MTSLTPTGPTVAGLWGFHDTRKPVSGLWGFHDTRKPVKEAKEMAFMETHGSQLSSVKLEKPWERSTLAVKTYISIVPRPFSFNPIKRFPLTSKVLRCLLFTDEL
jgi:hypothetical protein